MLTILAVLIPALIGMAATLGGAALTNRKNKQLNERQYEQQRQLNQEANETNVQNYLGFESPAAMVDQLEKAKLNKGLMYSKGAGNGGVTGSTAGSAPQAIPYQNPTLGLSSELDRIQSLKMTTAQIENIEAHTDLMKEQAGKEKEIGRNYQLQNNWYDKRAQKEIDKIESDIERNQVENAYTETLAAAQEWQTSFDIAKSENELERLKLVNQEIKENIEVLKTQPDLIQAQIENFKSQTNLNKIDARTRHQINQNTADNLYSQTMKNNYQMIYDGLRVMLEADEWSMHKQEIQKNLDLLDEKIKQAEFVTNHQEFTYHIDNVMKASQIIENLTESYDNVSSEKGKQSRGDKMRRAAMLIRLAALLK